MKPFDDGRTGSTSTVLIAPHRLSTVVGAIYDCAIDPERWRETLRELCVDLRCMFSNIILFDPGHSKVRFLKAWNYDVDLILQNKGYLEDLMLLGQQLQFGRAAHR